MIYSNKENMFCDNSDLGFIYHSQFFKNKDEAEKAMSKLKLKSYYLAEVEIEI